MEYGPENVSPEYAKLREELLEAEIALKDQREKVAELRRKLPQDTVVEDYPLRVTDLDGDAALKETRLSALFDDPGKPLVLMHFMYGGSMQDPCPMCTMWADGYDGVVSHLRQRVNFGVLVAGDLATFRRYAEGRGWRNLRLVSSEGTSFKRDFRMETPEGGQIPGASVFVKRGDQVIHTSTSSAMMRGQFRGMDLLSPVWNFFDLTPEGRGDFFPAKSYD